jgi:tetratricopeptide (TPR) repeat protein
MPDNNKLLSLLPKLMPGEYAADTAVDSVFDEILSELEDRVAPIIIDSFCADKYKIVKELRDTVEYYRVLGKLPELIGRKVIILRGRGNYFHVPSIKFHGGKIGVWCVNASEQRVEMSEKDMGIVKENAGLHVPVRAFLYSDRKVDCGDVLVYLPYETVKTKDGKEKPFLVKTEYGDVCEFFSRSGASKNINIETDVSAILQRAFQYYEAAGLKTKRKLGELNKELTLTGGETIREMLASMRGKLLSDIGAGENADNKLYAGVAKFYELLKAARHKLTQLCKGRLDADTPEDAKPTSKYTFKFRDFEIKPEQYAALSDDGLRMRIGASGGNFNSIKAVALSEYKRRKDKSLDYILDLWQYLQEHGYSNPSGDELQSMGHLYYKKEDYHKAKSCFERANTALSHFLLGKIYEKGLTPPKNLKSALKHYSMADKMGFSGADEGIYRIERQLEAREEESSTKYDPVKNYDPDTSDSDEEEDLCFVTTAVCESFGKPDDCYELMMFRRVRDEWVRFQPDGEAMIRKYYEIAPKIVSAIDARPDRDAIYRRIWANYLEPALSAIEDGDYPACVNLYTSMVEELAERY